MTRDDQLLVDVMAWLADDDHVADYLDDAEIGSDIVVAGKAAETDASPRVFVGTSESSSSRQNTREAKEFEVRVGVFASKRWVSEEGGTLLELTRLKSRVKDVLTTHRDGWGSEGVQSDEEVQPTTEPDGYLGVVSVGFERTDPHKTYQ